MTYHLLTIASFRIGVPSILLLVKKLAIEKTKTTFIISVLKDVYLAVSVFLTSNFYITGGPTSIISTSTNFIAIGIELVLVELLCSKISTSGNWLCSTH